MKDFSKTSDEIIKEIALVVIVDAVKKRPKCFDPDGPFHLMAIFPEEGCWDISKIDVKEDGKKMFSKEWMHITDKMCETSRIVVLFIPQNGSLKVFRKEEVV